MIPELGQFALLLALSLAFAQAIFPIYGALRGRVELMAVAVPAARGQFVFIVCGFAALAYAFLTNDFSVAYVAANSNTALPWYYRFAAVWGAHEGSLLLWVLILAVWSVTVTVFSRELPVAFRSRVLGVMGVVSCGFLLFLLATSDPFTRLDPAPLQGRDLNPLLQDPGLVMHPPMLYMGYVGFCVAFSFAVAALLGGRLDSAWARWSRPWTTGAWVFLTIGIAMGSYWAYYELGWGGWWFWDPVENASFMPWLAGTALIHSLAVTEKRGAFKRWTVLLAILTFSLSLLGTFLVRSGVLTSVHAFATDPLRGVFVLGLLVAVVGGSLALYAWRAAKVRSIGRFELLSRETMLLLNNAVLTVAAATVLLGTLYPLAMDAFGLGQVSVGEPYFNSVFLPLGIPLLVLVAIGPLLKWKGERWPDLMHKLRGPLLIAGIALLVLTWWLWQVSLGAVLGITLAVWVATGSFEALRERVSGRRNSFTALRRLPRSIVGMALAHLGLAVFVAGVTAVNTFESSRDLQMRPGDAYTVGDYTFRFDGTQSIQGPNYQATEARVEVLRDGKSITVLHPQKRVYQVQRSPMTEAAIDGGIFRDMFVALGEPLGNEAWSFRIRLKPLVRWIWFGAVMMAIGGVICITDPRYRRLLAREAATRQSTVEERFSEART
ncbi:heme lyase CcmF/NrfE family subunit [Nitrococcus mobilis]|uniref:Cytochrome c-type biogenesis protein CcmF n=1 Tax=Nitrococcus mobilis Nb-231 TaxID=314278 RepID=A4BUK8_9GAMM|nr:heme lyase CcmF/NrfE family subunit [Nitrococcus mobilis]EAR20574.1 Cytochrome c-type biogenesis protein CcmF [Nitrococcus mobilis Nb-231]